jgi:hypothetical protein
MTKSDSTNPAIPSFASPVKGRGEIEARILEAVRSLRFGTVEVTVHASEVVQIERREKVRFERDSAQAPAHRRRDTPPEPPSAG